MQQRCVYHPNSLAPPSRPLTVSSSLFSKSSQHSRRHTCLLRATPQESSEFEGVEGNEDLQEALMQQLRVQIETQTLKEEIKEDLKGKAEEMKQIGDEVCCMLTVPARDTPAEVQPTAQQTPGNACMAVDLLIHV